jgi:hypothetical protein
MEPLVPAQQSTQADEFVADLIERWVDLPGMQVRRVRRIDVSFFFRRNAKSQPGNDVERVERQRAFEMFDRGVWPALFEIRLGKHAMRREAGRIGIDGVRARRRREGIIPTVHRVLRTANELN